MKSLDKEEPPGKNPDGYKNPIGWASVLERIAALAVRDFGGSDFQAHLPAQHARYESPYRVSLPAGCFHEICARGATGALQQVQELGSFTALAAAGGFLTRLGGLCGLVGFLRRGDLFGRLALRRRDVARGCADTRLFGRSWLPRWGTDIGVSGIFWNIVHFDFSFSGDYRDDHINHSRGVRLQGKSVRNLRLPQVGLRSQGWSQIGTDGARC
jgi:hypothetical protein